MPITLTLGEGHSFPSGKSRQMIAAPIEPKISKVGQALAMGFIVFLVALSVWELFAIRF